MKIHVLLETLNVTLFGNRILADVISCVCHGLGQALRPVVSVLITRTCENTDTEKNST